MCKNCYQACGHMARTRRCPLKGWAGALVSQPSASREEKNLEPRKPQQLQTPGLLARLTEAKKAKTATESLGLTNPDGPQQAFHGTGERVLKAAWNSAERY
ncbi:protein FAM90A27P-like [Prionailurus iriomotensis]